MSHCGPNAETFVSAFSYIRDTHLCQQQRPPDNDYHPITCQITNRVVIRLRCNAYKYLDASRSPMLFGRLYNYAIARTMDGLNNINNWKLFIGKCDLHIRWLAYLFALL